jgi:hypothetical protein
MKGSLLLSLASHAYKEEGQEEDEEGQEENGQEAPPLTGSRFFPEDVRLVRAFFVYCKP